MCEVCVFFIPRSRMKTALRLKRVEKEQDTMYLYLGFEGWWAQLEWLTCENIIRWIFLGLCLKECVDELMSAKLGQAVY